MHRVGRRAATSVKVERLLLLVAVENQVEFAVSVMRRRYQYMQDCERDFRCTGRRGRSSPMREEGFPSKQQMRLASSQTLKALQQFVVDALGTKLVDQVVVVDRHLHNITRGSKRSYQFRRQ